jgi:hypothetical protein
MSTRLAAVFALVALARPAWAEPPPEASGSEATTSRAESGDVEGSSEVCEADPSTTGVQAVPVDTKKAVTPAPEAAPRRPLTMKTWARDIRPSLSLREFIQTSPLVVGGLKLYLVAEPIAGRQRPDSTSQLTFAFAPDRVVVLGAF